MNKRLQIYIMGRVQGVFFRVSTKGFAEKLGVNGFVKNLPDGRVQIVAEGDEAGLRKLLDWCYRGSFLAKVESLSFEWQENKKEFNEFFVDYESKDFFTDKKAALKNLSKHVKGKLGIETTPKHLVIIPDGNRRWAQEKGLATVEGHKKGFDNVNELGKAIRDLGIKYFTLWGFSTENWKRSKDEVGKLMEIFLEGLEKFRKDAMENRVAFTHFGRKDRLPKKLVEGLAALERDTAHFTDYHFALALDYGGRDEMVRAMQKVTDKGLQITEENISSNLDTASFPDPDLVIRTSGEQRHSGILQWQSAYAEYYYTPVYFPDFDAQELETAVQDYSNRKRRFGGS